MTSVSCGFDYIRSFSALCRFAQQFTQRILFAFNCSSERHLHFIISSFQAPQRVYKFNLVVFQPSEIAYESQQFCIKILLERKASIQNFWVETGCSHTNCILIIKMQNYIKPTADCVTWQFVQYFQTIFACKLATISSFVPLKALDSFSMIVVDEHTASKQPLLTFVYLFADLFARMFISRL